MSFTKAIKEKVGKGSQSRKPTIDISKLISGEPIIDENSVLELDTDRVINKDQIRTQFNDKYIAELAASMVEVGQIQPIVVSPPNKAGQYEIQKGECRWRAAKLKGMKIKAIVDARTQSDTDIIFGELVENIQRDDLKPLEIAVAFKGLKDGGMKQGDIARKMGKNDAFVSRHLKLLDMPECVKQLYFDNVVKDVPTLNNLTKLYKMNPDRVRGICQAAPQTGLSRKQCDNFVKEEANIGNMVNKDENPAAGEPGQVPSSSVNMIQDFAHVQNFSDIEGQDPDNDQANNLSDLAIDEPLDQKYVDANNIDGSASMEASSPQSTGTVKHRSLTTDEDEDDDDGMLFRDGQPGMFAIQVKVQDGRIGVICLDRKDTDAEHIWVDVDSEKVRVHIDQLSIVRTLG